MKPAATLATFADFRIVKTRKLAQFVFEVPIEDADKALDALGGLPRSDGERWCGIALVHKESVRVSPPADAGHGSDLPVAPTPAVASPETVVGDASKPFSRTRQAAIACNNPRFQEWVAAKFDNTISRSDVDSDLCAELVRDMLGVKSRREFDTDDLAGYRWTNFYIKYQQETGQMAEIR